MPREPGHRPIDGDLLRVGRHGQSDRAGHRTIDAGPQCLHLGDVEGTGGDEVTIDGGAHVMHSSCDN